MRLRGKSLLVLLPLALASTFLVGCGADPGPVMVGATAGNQSATVTWLPPLASQKPIVAYVVTPFINHVAQTPTRYNAMATTRTVTGLTNGTTYTFSVTAINVVGSDSASSDESNAVTPSVPPTFAAQTDYPIPRDNRAVSVADGDLNGDHIPDLVAVSGVGFSVFTGDGHGGFTNTITYDDHVAVGEAAIGDLNGDTYGDLVIATSSTDSVSVYLGNGDGTFPSPNHFPTGDAPRSVALTDLNGDTYLDVITTNSGANTVSVLLGNGDGTFADHVDYATGTSPRSLVVADLNGDGNVDVATAASGADSVSVLLGAGDGTLAGKVDYPSPRGAFWVATGDLNGDTIPDLVVAGQPGPVLETLHGNGDGTFGEAVDLGVDVDGYFPSVMVGDLNGDGLPDLTAATITDIEEPDPFSHATVLRGAGVDTFAPPQAVGLGFLSTVEADFNGDGRLDLAGPSTRGAAMTVLLNTTD